MENKGSMQFSSPSRAILRFRDLFNSLLSSISFSVHHFLCTSPTLVIPHESVNVKNRFYNLFRWKAWMHRKPFEHETPLAFIDTKYYSAWIIQIDTYPPRILFIFIIEFYGLWIEIFEPCCSEEYKFIFWPSNGSFAYFVTRKTFQRGNEYTWRKANDSSENSVSVAACKKSKGWRTRKKTTG